MIIRGILIIFITYFYYQNVNNELIIGKWLGKSKYLLQNSDTLNLRGTDNKDYGFDDIISFFPDGNGIVEPDQKFSYNLEENNLTMGNRNYQIIKINKDSLILSDSRSGNLVYHLIFIRYDK